ncbi:uncharacterized protein LOC135223076 [Macrobrachium nipponense]|uniref:uncharacterized protein LOC135223076 n=1 Tax=Macrobrachium nipponense TaxID=159736 RepID=UPI0030C7A3C8
MKLGSGVIFDEAECEVHSCLSAYPLHNVPEILKLFGFNCKQTVDALEELIKIYKCSEMDTSRMSNVMMNDAVMDNFIYEFSKNAQVNELSGRATYSGIDASNLRNGRSSAVCQPVEFTNTNVSVTKGPHLERVISKVNQDSPPLAVDKNQFSVTLHPTLSQGAVSARKTSTVSPKAIKELDGDKIMNNYFPEVYDKSSFSINTTNQPMFNPVALPISNGLVRDNTTCKISDSEEVWTNVFATHPTLTQDPKTCDVLGKMCVFSMETPIDQFQFTTGRDVISVTGGKETVVFSEPSKPISCPSLLQDLEVPRNRCLKHNVNQSELRKPIRLSSGFSFSGSVASGNQEKLNSIQCIPTHKSVTVSDKENDNGLFNSNADCCKPSENVHTAAIQEKISSNLVAARHSLNSGSCEPGKNNSLYKFGNLCLSSDVITSQTNQMTLAAHNKIVYDNVSVVSPCDLYMVNKIPLKNENQNLLTTDTSASANSKKVEDNCHSVSGCKEFRGNDSELNECDSRISHERKIGDPQSNMNQAGSRNVSLPQLTSGSQIIHNVDEHHDDGNNMLKDVRNEELGKKNSLSEDQAGSAICGFVTDNLQFSDSNVISVRKYPRDNSDCEARNICQNLGSKDVTHSQFAHDASLKINSSSAEMSVVEISEKGLKDSNKSQCCEEDSSPNKKPVNETEGNLRVSHLSGCTDCEEGNLSNVIEVVDRSSSEKCDLEARNVTHMEQATRKVKEKLNSTHQHKSEEKFCREPVILYNSPVNRIIYKNTCPELLQTPPQPRAICQLSTEEAKETEADVDYDKQPCHSTSLKMISPPDGYATNIKMNCELSSSSDQNSRHTLEKFHTVGGSQLLTEEEEEETKADREYDNLDSPPNVEDREQLLQELKFLDLSLQLKKHEYKTIVNNVTDVASPLVHHTLEKLKLVISELKEKYKKKKNHIKNLTGEPVCQLEMEKQQPCHAARLKVKSLPERHTTDVKKPCERSSASDQNSKRVWEKCPTNTDISPDQNGGDVKLPVSLGSNRVTVKNLSNTENLTEGHKEVSTMLLVITVYLVIIYLI